MKLWNRLLALAAPLVLSACFAVPTPEETFDPTVPLTLERIRSVISVGMLETEIAPRIGQPAVTVRDSDGSQAWRYEHVAGEAETATQPTKRYEVIVKIDDKKRVRDIVYRTELR